MSTGLVQGQHHLQVQATSKGLSEEEANMLCGAGEPVGL